MAREYEMQFRLNAQMGSSYSSTFKAAQRELTQFQKEYNSLAKAQSDISAYQKQQTAVENTQKKMQALQQQYDNIQREIKETEGFSSELENKLISKQQQIDRTSQALQSQTARLEQYKQALKDAGINTDDLQHSGEALRDEMENIRKKMDEAGDGAESFGDRGGQAVSEIAAALAAAGITKMLKEIYDAFLECVGIAGDFEEAMSNVEALSGASASEIAELSEMAQQLGATTKFTAKESADAMGYMAMAGWDVADMLYGMDGVLQLAAASGEDLATVSDIVTDSLSAFGLRASDTAHFSDVLAAAATNSNTNVSIMGETFKMSASIAGALGYSIEDVAVAVGLMANSGVKGSVAGTALKNTFNGLLEGVTLTGAAFGEYEFTAVKADGTMKDFGSTIDELRVYFAQMTEAERVNNAMAIAGQRGYNGLLAILNATDEDYASLTNSINSCTGAASKMASIKLDNMNGQLTLAKSAWDALEMSLGEQFTPTMTKLYQIGADVFASISDIIKQNPALVKAIGAFIAIFGSVVAIMLAYSVAAKAAAAASALLSSAIPGVKTIMAVTAAFAGLVAIITSLTSESVSDIAAREMIDEFSESAQDLRKTVEETSAAYEDSMADIEGSTAQAKKYADRLAELESQQSMTQIEAEEYRLTVEKLNAIMPDLNLSINEQTGLLEGGATAIQSQIDSWHDLAVAQALQARFTDQIQAQAEAEAELATNLARRSMLEQELAEIEPVVNEYYERRTAILENAPGDEVPYTELSALDAEYSDVITRYHEIVGYEGVSGSILPNTGELYAVNQAIAEGEAAVEETRKEVNLADAAWNEYQTTMQETSDETDSAADVLEEYTVRLQDLNDAYSEAYDTAYASISGQFNLWETAPEIVEKSVGDMIAAMQSQTAYWSSYSSSLDTILSYTGQIEGLGDVVADLGSGSEDAVAYSAAIAQALQDGNIALVEQLVTEYQNLKMAQEEAAGKFADVKTGYTDKVLEMAQEIAAGIEELDIDQTAYDLGELAIEQFVNGAEGQLPIVQEAYGLIGEAAANALFGAFDLSKISTSGGPHKPTNGGMEAYASGTRNAKRGYAWVGEDGPEIVYFNGGEEVLSAEESKYALQVSNGMSEQHMPAADAQIIGVIPQLMEAMNVKSVDAISVESAAPRGGEIVLHFAPSYSISGSNPEEVEAVLKAHDEEMRDMVLEILEAERTDAERRAYK